MYVCIRIIKTLYSWWAEKEKEEEKKAMERRQREKWANRKHSDNTHPNEDQTIY